MLCHYEEKSQIDSSHSNLQIHLDDNYFISLSYVMSCLYHSNQSIFEQALSDARSMVYLINLFTN